MLSDSLSSSITVELRDFLWLLFLIVIYSVKIVRFQICVHVYIHSFLLIKYVSYPYSTTNKVHMFRKLFILVKRSACFGRSFGPSSGAQNCTYGNRHMSNSCCYLQLSDICLLLYVQFWAPDDGPKNRSKHAERLTRSVNKVVRLIQYNSVLTFKLQIEFVPFKIVPLGGYTPPETLFPLFVTTLVVANRNRF